MNPKDNLPSNDSGSNEPQVISPQQVDSPASVPHQQTNVQPHPRQTFAGGVEPLTSSKKKRPGNKILMLVAIFLVAGLGAGGFAYWRILNNSPEKVLADALSNSMKDVLDRKPIHLAGTITYVSKSESNPFTISVDLDSKQVGDNGEATVKVNVKASNSLDVTVDAAFAAEGSEAFYFKLDNLQKTVDDIASLAGSRGAVTEFYQPYIDILDGQWVKVDEKSLEQLGFAESEESADRCASAVGNLRISDEDKGRVREIFQNNQFAIVTEELPAENVDGEGSFHYKLDFNEQASLQFAKEFIELESFKGVKDACEIEAGDIDESISQLESKTDEEVPSKIKPVFELWVSKKTRYPTKIKLTLDDKEFSMENIATVKIDAPNLSVKIPEDYMTFDQLTAEVNKLLGVPQGQALGWNDIRKEIKQN